MGRLRTPAETTGLCRSGPHRCKVTDPHAGCTPWNFPVWTEVVRPLAEPHVELVLIHPFRDGNGRLARVLSTLMALQAGLPLLDFSVIAGEKKREYFGAIRAGLEKIYTPMERLFTEIIERSLAAS